MGVIWAMGRSAIRRNRWSLVGLAAIIGLVTAIVLAGAAGARRTTAALDGYLSATNARDFGVHLMTADVVTDLNRTQPIADAIGEVDGVTDVHRGLGYFATVPGLASDSDFIVVASPDGSYDRVDHPLLQRGRMPNPSVATEVVLNETGVEATGMDVGDTLTVETYSPKTIVGLYNGDGFPDGLDGPTIDLDVVGVVKMGEELSATTDVATGMALASPAFVDEYEGRAGRSILMLSAKADQGTDLDRVQQIADAQIGDSGQAFVNPIADDFVNEVRSANRTLAAGILAFILVAGAAGLLAIGQALSRQNLLRVADDLVARGLGASTRARLVAVALPTIAAVLAGITAGSVAAIALSPLFPLGSARRAEVHPGIQVDLPILIALALIIGATCVIWAALSARRVLVRNDGRAATRARSPRVSTRITSWGLSAPATYGLRSVTNQDSRSSVPARSAIFGTTVAVAGVAALAVFGASLHEAEVNPAHWGWAWSAAPDLESQDPEESVDEISKDPDVASTGVIRSATLSVGSDTLWAYALDTKSGSMRLTLLDGTLPTGPSEIALGKRSLEASGLDIGDQIDVVPPGGEPKQFSIVGTVVPPLLEGADPGKGAVLTTEALMRLRPESPSILLLLTYRNGVEVASLEARLAAEYGLVFNSSGPSAPGALQQLGRMRTGMVALGCFLGFIGVIGLIHFLAVSIRRRRPQFAVLRAIGFVDAQVRRSVMWQATIATAVGTAIGAPIGIIVGRTAWLTAVSGIGMIDTPATPMSAIAIVMVVAIVGSAILAIGPGWYAARGRPAEILRTE